MLTYSGMFLALAARLRGEHLSALDRQVHDPSSTRTTTTNINPPGATGTTQERNMSDDGSVKIYAKQYESKKGTRYYWGKHGGFEVRVFRGKDHEGVPSLDVHVKAIAADEDEPAAATTPQPEQDNESIPF